MTVKYSFTKNLEEKLKNHFGIDLYSLFYNSNNENILRDKNGKAVCSYSVKMKKWEIFNASSLIPPNQAAPNRVDKPFMFNRLVSE